MDAIGILTFAATLGLVIGLYLIIRDHPRIADAGARAAWRRFWRRMKRQNAEGN